MEGAENFDFFRQPDFVEEPFLTGSYAVYKKETMVGEGTWQLCHVHRPEIIDARGRRCWGELAVVGNELRITIPEKWLSEAKYPVIVDPTIGTTTVGSQTTGTDPNNPGYDRPMLDSEYALNKFLVPQSGNGVCTAYVYCYNTDCDWDLIPIIYTNVNNMPYMRKSLNENIIDVTVSPPSWPVGWKSNTFQINGNITAGDYIWFGGWAHYFTTKFDYGGECYKGWFDWNLYEEYLEEHGLAPYIHSGQWDIYCTIKWSWYFNYTAINGQNYYRTLTQGVTLSDNRRISEEFKRITAQTVQANAMPTKQLTILKRIQEILQGFDLNSSLLIKIRRIQEGVNLSDTMCHLRTFIRGLIDIAGIESEAKTGWVQIRKISDTVQAVGIVFRGLLLFVRIVTGVFVRDYLLSRFLKAKSEITLKSCVTKEITLESKIM
jgi:transposase-like protein